MKIKSLFFTALAATALASCSNDDDIANGVNPDGSDAGQALMSISLIAPQSGMTRAAKDSVGSVAETTIENALIVLLKGDNTVTQIVDLSAMSVNTPSKAFEVNNPDASDSIFVIANPTTTIKTLVTSTATWADIKKALTYTGTVTDDIAKDGHFMMNNIKLAYCKNKIKKYGPGAYSSKELAMSMAEKDPITVAVDRVVAKVSLSSEVTETKEIGVTGTAKDAVSITGWCLNVTNKKYFLMPEKETGLASSIYHKDPNYDNNTTTTLANEFNTTVFPSGATFHEFITKTTSNAYCLENTMTADEQMNAYTTQALLKAEYTPNGYTKGTSWFRFRGKAYENLGALQAAYNAIDPSDTKNVLKVACDALTAIVKPGTDFKDLVIADLDNTQDCANEVKDSGIEYFQKGICYYTILIRHDDAVTTEMGLGRWGVVRNNWYHLTVTDINLPGTPWIDTPSSKIKDDEPKSYLSVAITVNPWKYWTQNVEL